MWYLDFIETQKTKQEVDIVLVEARSLEDEPEGNLKRLLSAQNERD